MKLFPLTLSLCTAVLCVSGCRPQLAQVEMGEKEAAWDQFFRDNYASYKAPRNAPPAIQDNRTPEALAQESLKKAPAQFPGKNETPLAVEAPKDDFSEVAAVDAPVSDIPTVVPAAGKGAEKKAVKKAAPAPKVKAEAEVYNGKPVTYTVASGDSLSTIAKKFYKDGSKYYVILKANPQLKGNPNRVRIGMKLTIPQK